MKRLFILSILIFTGGLFAYSQDNYLEEANICFEKGDYDCAKRKYEAYQVMSGNAGTDVSEQMKAAEECLKIRMLADAYLEEKDSVKAGNQYRKIVELNPKDADAKKQYDLCITPTLTPAQKPASTSNSQLQIEMVFVRGGTFTMGNTSGRRKGYSKAEKPSHRVTVSDFNIGKYEVTQEQWIAIMGSNPSRGSKSDRLSVNNVSWDSVQDFIKKLNAQTGGNYRLPTEAEWEYAARGGAQGRGYQYSGSNSINEVAWYKSNAKKRPHPVGSKSSNELGIYDMSGNVWEWCSDWFGLYSDYAQTDPVGPSSGNGRVLRGAGFQWYVYKTARVSIRIGYPPHTKSVLWGFRLASGSK
ncbi:MAG: SUMF1/EgtB/PvdO family nonheme iron enzyme [Tannerella sp.]|jgi:formylglycine-generating enzyme required for sulfatase activity|nr:SUMF1/EgtB/PvdO family nonheme iron enzyme [Tannerella sp.]